MPSVRLTPLAGVALAFATVAGLSACGKKAPPPAPPPPTVGYIVVKTEPVSLTTELPGRTSAFVTADVRPQVNGIIKARLFTEGTDVRAGQVLYQIDAAPYRAAYDQAKATLANAQANLTTQKLQAGRYAELVKINAVSKQDNDNAQATYQQAAANVQQYQAALEAARINLGYTRITAPVSGRIGRSLVTIGSLATSGQTTALATIQALNPMYVDVSQSSDELLKLKRDMAGGELSRGGPQSVKATLVFSDGSKYPLSGQLKFSEAQVDPTTGSVTLRAVFPNPNGQLLPGMYVREIVTQAVDETGVLAPQQAVTRDPQGQATAMVVGPDGTAQPRKLVADRAIGDKWLVTAGLAPGDKLISEGLINLRMPGTKVHAVPAGSMPAKPPPGGPGGPGGPPGAAH
ncbi:efflux RND transporter periplasmic adaptor subunit [soil metagenome]